MHLKIKLNIVADDLIVSVFDIRLSERITVFVVLPLPSTPSRSLTEWHQKQSIMCTDYFCFLQIWMIDLWLSTFYSWIDSIEYSIEWFIFHSAIKCKHRRREDASPEMINQMTIRVVQTIKYGERKCSTKKGGEGGREGESEWIEHRERGHWM